MTNKSPEKAAKAGDVEAIRRLLDQGVPFSKEAVFDKALTDFRTVKRRPGHLEILKLLFDAGLTPESRIGWMNLPLLCACALYGNAEIVSYILARSRPRDVLSLAALGDVASLRAIAKRENLAGAIDVNGFNPLHYCAASALGRDDPARKAGLTETARLLLVSGVAAGLGVRNNLLLTPMLLCAWFGGNEDIMQLIIKAGVSPNTPGMGVLEFALEPHQRSGEPHYQVAETMLRLGADLEYREKPGDRTILHGAANRGSVKPTRWLLEHGADVTALDDQGRTALHLAAERNTEVSVVKLLLDFGADINRRDDLGRTPLDSANEHKRTRVAAFLRKRGAS